MTPTLKNRINEVLPLENEFPGNPEYFEILRSYRSLLDSDNYRRNIATEESVMDFLNWLESEYFNNEQRDTLFNDVKSALYQYTHSHFIEFWSNENTPNDAIEFIDRILIYLQAEIDRKNPDTEEAEIEHLWQLLSEFSILKTTIEDERTNPNRDPDSFQALMESIVSKYEIALSASTIWERNEILSSQLSEIEALLVAYNSQKEVFLDNSRRDIEESRQHFLYSIGETLPEDWFDIPVVTWITDFLNIHPESILDYTPNFQVWMSEADNIKEMGDDELIEYWKNLELGNFPLWAWTEFFERSFSRITNEEPDVVIDFILNNNPDFVSRVRAQLETSDPTLASKSESEIRDLVEVKILEDFQIFSLDALDSTFHMLQGQLQDNNITTITLPNWENGEDIIISFQDPEDWEPLDEEQKDLAIRRRNEALVQWIVFLQRIYREDVDGFIPYGEFYASSITESLWEVYTLWALWSDNNIIQTWIWAWVTALLAYKFLRINRNVSSVPVLWRIPWINRIWWVGLWSYPSNIRSAHDEYRVLYNKRINSTLEPKELTRLSELELSIDEAIRNNIEVRENVYRYLIRQAWSDTNQMDRITYVYNSSKYFTSDTQFYSTMEEVSINWRRWTANIARITSASDLIIREIPRNLWLWAKKRLLNRLGRESIDGLQPSRNPFISQKSFDELDKIYRTEIRINWADISHSDLQSIYWEISSNSQWIMKVWISDWAIRSAFIESIEADVTHLDAGSSVRERLEKINEQLEFKLQEAKDAKALLSSITNDRLVRLALIDAIIVWIKDNQDNWRLLNNLNTNRVEINDLVERNLNYTRTDNRIYTHFSQKLASIIGRTSLERNLNSLEANLNALDEILDNWDYSSIRPLVFNWDSINEELLRDMTSHMKQINGKNPGEARLERESFVSRITKWTTTTATPLPREAPETLLPPALDSVEAPDSPLFLTPETITDTAPESIELSLREQKIDYLYRVRIEVLIQNWSLDWFNIAHHNTSANNHRLSLEDFTARLDNDLTEKGISLDLGIRNWDDMADNIFDGEGKLISNLLPNSVRLDPRIQLELENIRRIHPTDFDINARTRIKDLFVRAIRTWG